MLFLVRRRICHGFMLLIAWVGICYGFMLLIACVGNLLWIYVAYCLGGDLL